MHLLLDAKTIDLRRHPLLDPTREQMGQIVEYDFLMKNSRSNETGSVYRKRNSILIEIGTRLIEIAKRSQTEDWESERLSRVYGDDEFKGSPIEQDLTYTAGSTEPEDERKRGDAISNDLEELHYEKLLTRATAASRRI